MDIKGSITGDLARVALVHGDGRLEHAPALAQALRGALLIDLARMGRLTIGPDGTQVDTSDSGWPLADIALHDIDDHPTATMERLIQHGEPHLTDFADALVDAGCWRIKREGIGAGHHRYQDVDETTFGRRLAELCGVVDGAACPDDRTAILATLAEVIGLTDVNARVEVRAELLTSCGAAEAITRDVVQFVQTALRIDLATAVLDGFAGLGGSYPRNPKP